MAIVPTLSCLLRRDSPLGKILGVTYWVLVSHLLGLLAPILARFPLIRAHEWQSFRGTASKSLESDGMINTGHCRL
jgi:hypothetical protein